MTERRKAHIHMAILALFFTLVILGCNGTGSTSSEPISEPASSEEILEVVSEEVSEPEEVAEPVKVDAGTYEVGVDIPGGEYTVFAYTLGYFEVKASDEIIASDFFSYNAIVTLNEGESVTFLDSYAVSYGSEPIDTTGQGMFKVGVDVPAGGHYVYSDNGFGHITVYSDSRFQEASVIKDEEIGDSYYITLNDGEYVKLQTCYFEQEK